MHKASKIVAVVGVAALIGLGAVAPVSASPSSASNSWSGYPWVPGCGKTMYMSYANSRINLDTATYATTAYSNGCGGTQGIAIDSSYWHYSTTTWNSTQAPWIASKSQHIYQGWNYGLRCC